MEKRFEMFGGKTGHWCSLSKVDKLYSLCSCSPGEEGFTSWQLFTVCSELYGVLPKAYV